MRQPNHRHSCYALQMLQKGLVESMRMGDSAYWLHVAGCRNPYADAGQLPAMAPTEIQGVNRPCSTTYLNLKPINFVSSTAKHLKSGPSLRSILIASRTASGLSQCFVTDGHPIRSPWLLADDRLHLTGSIAFVLALRRAEAVLEPSSAATLQFTVSRS